MQKHGSKSSQEWFKTRKNILKNIKQRVTKILGSPGTEVKQYAQDYEREVSRRWRPSTKSELIQQIINSEIVFGADFHAHAQSQRTHLRILRALPADKVVTLALECLESRDQKIIDLFLRDKISEKEFLRQVDWEERWGFAWSHYRPLFELAKQRKYKIVGLNKYCKYTNQKTLTSRDVHAAKILSKIIKSSPSSHLCYVVFGEFHLSKNNLPYRVLKQTKKELRMTTVFQNAEKVYFELVKQKKDLLIDVVKFSPNTFCISNSAPWVKWQSYLLFLEKSVDYDTDDDDDSQHVTDVFLQQLAILKSEFHKKIDTSRLTVFSSGTLNVKSLIQGGQISKYEIERIEKAILNEESFVIPQFHLVYIARMSLNHVSAQAGVWLYISTAKIRKLPWQMPQDFSRLIWLEAMGFFCSKILNPERKLDTLTDLMNSASQNRSHEVEVLKICLSYKRYEIQQQLKLSKQNQIRKWAFMPRRKSSYYTAAQKLGAMIGEQMFWGYRNGTIRRRLVLDWLNTSTDSAAFDDFYFEVLNLLSKMPVVMKSKEERL